MNERRRLCGACVMLALVALVGVVKAAEPVRLGSLEIGAPWARASVGTERPTAAYMTVRNTGDQPDRLLRVEAPIAGRAEIHAMVEEDDVMKMRPAGDLEIPPGGEVRLEPGGLHLMLMQLERPLEEGGTVPFTLVFERAGEVTIEVPVATIGAREAPGLSPVAECGDGGSLTERAAGL